MSAEFPFVGITRTVADSRQKLPMFREYEWDFDKDTFIYTNGKRNEIEGNKALEIWIYKALKTDRNQYLAYSSRYGIELKPFIGKVMGINERYSELQRIITECLMVNPYIKSIDSVEFTADGDRVLCEIELTTIYGEVNINV